jgi:hypothetical protein
VTKTDLERREDRRKKDALYDHPSTRRYVAERDAKPGEGDALRRKHGEETGAMVARQHEEKTALRHKHRMEMDRHNDTSRLRPLEMEKRHKEEVADLDKEHRRERERQAEKHRTERDRLK